MDTVVFRADSSFAIGTGHVMRCLTLAGALRERGWICHFLCQELKGNINSLIVQSGFDLVVLPDRSPEKAKAAISDLSPEWVIVDHYDLDAEWEKITIPEGVRTLVIDDLANRSHRCDIVLDQNLGRGCAEYKSLVPPGSTLLIGPDFALLRSEFSHQRKPSIKRREHAVAEHLLINFGGSDPIDATTKTLMAVSGELAAWLKVTVVMGQSATSLDRVQKLAASIGSQVEVLVQVENMARLMSDADVAIGAAGSTAWERCCLGLPAGLIIIADNQVPVANGLEAAGAAAILADLTRSPDLTGALAFLQRVRADREFVRNLSTRSSALTDGQGANRVADAMDQVGVAKNG